MTPEPVAGADALTEAERELRCRREQISHEHYTRESVERIARDRVAAAVADLRAELDEARAQVAAVRALHRPDMTASGSECRECSYAWPCATALRLDAPAAAQPERDGGLHACEGCGIELDGDDVSSHCDECSDGAS